jgi:phosphatidylserine/phosphatidylglycerophosphate/cardiolipin synthase-like enzyme
MAITVGGITMHVGGPGAADDLEAAIVGFLDAATASLDIAVQELESQPIADAILRAKLRGVRVRLALEGDYLTEVKALADPWATGGENEANRRIHAALLRARVPTITDLNPSVFHQKFVARDLGVSGKAAVLTGSTNFTPTDTSVNLNHLLIVKGERIAKTYAAEFAELWTGTFGAVRERHDPEPFESKIGGVRVRVLFAPDHAPEMEMMKQMLKARQGVEFAIFTFTRTSGIDDTMVALQRGGIPVRGILDRGQGNQTWAATKDLQAGRIDLSLIKAGSGVRKLHHKLMVIDGQVIVAGSFNYTDPANRLNDENLLVIGDIETTDAKEITLQTQLAGYARDEIRRIITAFGEPAPV